MCCVRSLDEAADEQAAHAAVESVVCEILDGLDALADAGVPTVAGRTILVGAGARSAAVRRILADLSGRELLVPDSDAHAASGAAVQAASVYHGRSAVDVAMAWGLGLGPIVEPALDPATAADIRARHRGRP